MSVLHIKQIANKLRMRYEKYLEISEIKGKKEDVENIIQTRCLAAFAVSNSIGCSDEEAVKSIVDGPDDNGIDAVFYSAREKKMVIVQSKWSNKGTGEPEKKDVSTVCTGIRDLFNCNFERFNEKVNEKRDILEIGMSAYDTKYEVVLIDTYSASTLSKHAQRYIDDLKEEMNDIGEENQESIFDFYRLNQTKVYSLLANGDKIDPINEEIVLQNWGLVEEPFKAFYGVVSAEEIGKWWCNYGDRLFNDNLRQVLGQTDVNDEIEKTLKEDPAKFWFYNNGITLVAEEVKKNMMGGSTKEFGIFSVKGVSIINGAQTLSTIGKVLSKNGSISEDAKVSMRMISLGENSLDLKKEITKANNRQNRIENRDFLSQDELQLKLKTELKFDGIDYSIMRSEKFVSTDTSFDVQEATSSLACASGQTSLAVQAKRGIGKFYEDLSEKSIYRKIFNPSISGVYLYNCVRISRVVEKVLELKVKELDKKSGRENGVLIHGNKIFTLLVFNKLKKEGKEINSLSYKIDEEELIKYIDMIYKKIIKFLEENYKDCVIGTFFKNSTKCQELVDNN